uniref:Uncharacterized protein n=1 Tax=Manihot esculenta TaxID=3983 RepID=A0A2C9WGC7_MANES
MDRLVCLIPSFLRSHFLPLYARIKSYQFFLSFCMLKLSWAWSKEDLTRVWRIIIVFCLEKPDDSHYGSKSFKEKVCLCYKANSVLFGKKNS